MSYDLIENEKQYLSELKETKMIHHIGSGPVDEAPKEKEVKDPEADTKGVGTQQAGTKDPGKIPSIPALKKELAKENMSLAEELEWALENCGKDHNKDKKKIKEQKSKPDYIDIDKDGDKEEPMKKAAKEAEDEEDEELKEQDEAAEVEADSDAEEKTEPDDEKAEGGADVEEQMSLKQQNRMRGSDQKQYVPGSPAEKEARMAANTPPASIQPAAVQKMRRPIPGQRPTNLSDRMKGQPFQTRPVRMGRL
jgi:hypothetical protein